MHKNASNSKIYMREGNVISQVRVFTETRHGETGVVPWRRYRPGDVGCWCTVVFQGQALRSATSCTCNIIDNCSITANCSVETAQEFHFSFRLGMKPTGLAHGIWKF